MEALNSPVVREAREQFAQKADIRPVAEQSSFGSSAERSSDSPRWLWTGGLLAAATWLLAAAVTAEWPDLTPWERSSDLAVIELVLGAALALLAISGRWLGKPGQRLQPIGPWLV